MRHTGCVALSSSWATPCADQSAQITWSRGAALFCIRVPNLGMGRNGVLTSTNNANAAQPQVPCGGTSHLALACFNVFRAA